MGRPLKKQPIIEASKVPGIMPLDYMISVIRDETATQDRRDRMAVAAAPYCHARVIEAERNRPPGKKEQQAEAAEIAGVGTPWENLDFEIRAQC